ncbi:MAG: hypothetical protein ABSA46_21230 [Thermodesulfovibrionales bacterium]|jgi:hypothetical protein
MIHRCSLFALTPVRSKTYFTREGILCDREAMLVLPWGQSKTTANEPDRIARCAPARDITRHGKRARISPHLGEWTYPNPGNDVRT